MEESQEKELNKIEASNLSDTELKMVVRVLKELSGNYNSIKKEIKTINKNQEEMKNTISEKIHWKKL